MASQITVAALQLCAHDRSEFSTSWPQMRAAVEQALAAKSDLLILPEASIPGYVLGEDRVESAPIDEAIGELAAIARRHATAILVGAVQPVGEKQMNAAILLDRDGSIAGRADKLFLWHFDRRWFTAGDRIAPIPSSIGAIGALVCADGRIPTIAATLVERGASLLAMPTAWVTSGRDPQMLENLQADLLVRVRAYENGVPFIAANKCGGERGIARYCGKSVIVSSQGDIIAQASQEAQEVIRGTLALSSPRQHVFAALRRPESFNGSLPMRRRVAISANPHSITATMRSWLDAPDSIEDAWLVDDAAAISPIALADARLRGMRIFAWRSTLDATWCRQIARARAAELRCYGVIHHLPSGVVFAVDPDGAVTVATSQAQPITAVALDLDRTEHGELAPGSDAIATLREIDRIRGQSQT